MPSRSEENSFFRSHFGPILIFALLTLFIFKPVLLTPGDRIVSSPTGDLMNQLLPLQAFGFGELRHWHVAQWNPYLYGGEPFMAGFQSALFYPPNWLHLAVPLVPAVNWLTAFHIFLAAVTMYAWVRGRGASAAGGALAGIMFMFCGPVYLRVYAGQLSHLVVLPWPPLLMLAVDKLASTGRFRWCLPGTGAMAMAILGGSPQYVYYTGLIAGAYVAVLLWKSPFRLQLISGVGGIFVGACLLSAVQLFPGMQASTETVRSGGTDYNFASLYAMAPENFLTAIMPGFFGQLASDTHPNVIEFFGRTNAWEASLFVSVSGLSLAVLAGISRWRRNGPLSIVVLLTIVLALGKHLPLYRLLFNDLPLYSTFRTQAKFIFFTAMFISPMAADGLDLLRSGQGRTTAVRGAVVIGAASLSLIALAIWLNSTALVPGSAWFRLLHFIGQSKECAQSQWLRAATSVRLCAANAAREAVEAAVVAAAAAVLVAVSGRWPRASISLVFLAGLEMTTFARATWVTTPAAIDYPSEWRAAARNLGDDRVINIGFSDKLMGLMDQGMMLGIRNVWGYDPSVLKRYAETMWYAEGFSAANPAQDLPIDRDSGGIFQMLRCKLELNFERSGLYTASALPNPMPIAQLVPGYTIIPGRDAELEKLIADDFNPRKLVVLEQPPVIVPSPTGTAGPAPATVLSTDAIEVHAVVERPTLLLVTENYSRGWHATPIGGGGAPQANYTILPANRTLMAIPLAAGVHDLRLDYVTPGYAVGKIVSVASLVVYLGCIAVALKRQRTRRVREIFELRTGPDVSKSPSPRPSLGVPGERGAS